MLGSCRWVRTDPGGHRQNRNPVLELLLLMDPVVSHSGFAM